MQCQDTRTMKRPFPDRLKQVASHVNVEYASTALGRFLGVSKQTVNEWMQGGEPSRRHALLISERCGVDLHWLMTDEGDMVPTPVKDDLTAEERMILRSYRRAGPDWKRAFISLARGVVKTTLLLSALLLYPPPSDAGYFFSASRTVSIMLNWLKGLLFRRMVLL